VTKRDAEAQVVMVGESAAAIMARQAPTQPRGRWPLFASLGAALVVVSMIVVVVVTRPRSISAPAGAALQTVGANRRSVAEAAAAGGALAAYRGYLSAYALAGQTPNPFDPRLEGYARGGALIQVQLSLRTMSQSGLAYRGGFKGQVRVTKVSLVTRTVFLLNCQDISDLIVVSKSTGKPGATSLQNLRFPVFAEARDYQGRWLIVKTTADRTRRC
jgi:hypothetical protein